MSHALTLAAKGAVLLLVLLLLVSAKAARADLASDKAAARQALVDQANATLEYMIEVANALEDPSIYAFIWETGFGPQVTTLPRQKVDAFVNYLQVETLLNGRAPDQARIAKAATALGIDGVLVGAILGDQQAVLKEQGSAGAHQRLGRLAKQHEPALEAFGRALEQDLQDIAAEAEQISAATSWPPGKAASNVFSPVQVAGMTMDYCLTFAATCGQPAADEFCRRNGYTRAASFDWSYQRPTRTLVSNETCDQDGCGGYNRITCE